MSWDLFFFFPNLAPPTPTPYEAPEGLCLCSADDERMAALEQNAANEMGRRMLTQFTTHEGAAYRPGCLLVRTDSDPAVRDVAVLRAFRNVCAVATTARGWAGHIAHPFGAQWTALWSDHFILGFHVPGRNGHVITLDGPVGGMDDEPPRGHSSAQIGRPDHFRLAVDRGLLDRLLVAWRRYFLRGVQRVALRRLFRSLEIAFHAGLFPGDGLTSINDQGTRLALWVSAFEALCHPGNRDVNKRDVQDMLRRAPFGRSGLTATRYTVRYRRQTFRATLPEAQYDDLYAARNRFLHGSPFTRHDLHYRRSTRYLPLIDIAPVLYSAALIGFLQGRVAGGPDVDPVAPRGQDVGAYVAAYIRRREGFTTLEEALDAARYQVDQFGHTQVPPARQAAQVAVRVGP
jgi:hypothetical protein